MIPPKTLNLIQAHQPLRRFRDCATLNTLPYATYGSAHQITLAAVTLNTALKWRSKRTGLAPDRLNFKRADKP